MRELEAYLLLVIFGTVIIVFTRRVLLLMLFRCCSAVGEIITHVAAGMHHQHRKKNMKT